MPVFVEMREACGGKKTREEASKQDTFFVDYVCGRCIYIMKYQCPKDLTNTNHSQLKHAVAIFSKPLVARTKNETITTAKL